MKFCSVINCMDGRVQLPVIQFLQRRFEVDCVDSITEAGPCCILAERNPHALVQTILDRLKISIEAHQSVGIAIVGHHDCTGNPVCRAVQMSQVKQAIGFLKTQAQTLEVIGLWVDEDWNVQEVASAE